MSEDELERLRAENERLRAALRTGASQTPEDQTRGRNRQILMGVGGGVIALLLLLNLMTTCSRQAPRPEAAPPPAAKAPGAGDAIRADAAKADAEVSAALAPPPPPPPAPPKPASAWVYDEQEEAMGGVTKTACVTSKDVVSLGWPYGPQKMRLCIRRSPKFGLDAYTHLEQDGQILCNTYSNCHIRVRFDDKPAQSWSGADAADGSSNIVFLRRTQSLITNIKGAKRLRIELQFYQNGQQSVEYDVAGLEW